MDLAFFLLFSALAVTGLCAIAVALFHPHPAQTWLIRIICWPNVKRADRLALPLGGMLFCMGVALASSSWLPFSARVAFVLLGAVSAIIFGLRRSEA